MSTAQENSERRQDGLTPPDQDGIPKEWLRRYARAYKKIIEWEEERKKREQSQAEEADEQDDN